jgi:hypothetical protein
MPRIRPDGNDMSTATEMPPALRPGSAGLTHAEGGAQGAGVRGMVGCRRARHAVESHARRGRPLAPERRRADLAPDNGERRLREHVELRQGHISSPRAGSAAGGNTNRRYHFPRPDAPCPPRNQSRSMPPAKAGEAKWRRGALRTSRPPARSRGRSTPGGRTRTGRPRAAPLGALPCGAPATPRA